jgi:hypothetical protein
MLVSDFPPSVEMGAQACWQIARNLPRHGWTPIVLTINERYIEYPDPAQAGFEAGFTVVRTDMLPHPLRVLRRLRASRKGGGETTGAVVASRRRRGWLRRVVLAGSSRRSWLAAAWYEGRTLPAFFPLGRHGRVTSPRFAWRG